LPINEIGTTGSGTARGIAFWRIGSSQWRRSGKEKAMEGNVQKMRKALIIVYDWILKAGNVYGYHDTEQKRRQLYDMMTKALSEPPRNCDRFSTWEEANKAFEKENAHRIGFMNLYTDVLKWLFAPSTEKEGETKGKSYGNG
jgi:hypothetical protein